MDSPVIVHRISECFIKPPHTSDQEHNQKQPPCYLTPWDLAMLSAHYIQKGLLFPKPPPLNFDQQDFNIDDFLDKLKHSLSLTLLHFYPLAGRLATQRDPDSASCVVFVDCNDNPGAGFIHAQVDMTISDVLSPTYVPLVVQCFFDHDRAINHDGHTRPLLTIQVTELVDGVFIGCSMNHCLGDGSSYWHFFNTWSEIFQAQGNNSNSDPISISRPPIISRWFPDDHGPIIHLPFRDLEQVIGPFEAPLLKERIFRFSSSSIAKIKARANAESNTTEISSFQALSAFVWRCITRSRELPNEQITSCRLACNNRPRLNPPLPGNYFGNSISPIRGFTTAGELMEKNLGWAACLLHEVVVSQDDKKIRDWIESWMKSPSIYRVDKLFDPHSVMMGSSPRFNKYGNEFGLGKAVTIRSGYGNKFSGKVTSYPGREGDGSMDLEACLPPHQMSALESDSEFMDAVTL